MAAARRKKHKKEQSDKTGADLDAAFSRATANPTARPATAWPKLINRAVKQMLAAECENLHLSKDAITEKFPNESPRNLLAAVKMLRTTKTPVVLPVGGSIVADRQAHVELIQLKRLERVEPYRREKTYLDFIEQNLAKIKSRLGKPRPRSNKEDKGPFP